jgi:hypothetical protein
MNLDRYQVTAKRLDNGEKITGLLCPPTHPAYVTEKWYVAIENTPESVNMHNDMYNLLHPAGLWECEEIDIETVEPATKPVKHEPHAVGDYRCPNCNAAFFEGAGRFNFCGNCGQGLRDWREMQGEVEQ